MKLPDNAPRNAVGPHSKQQQERPTDMHFGTVKTFDPVRQTGTIIPEHSRRPIRIDGGAVNRAGLGQVASGQRLGYSIATSRRGPRAVDLWATWSGR